SATAATHSFHYSAAPDVVSASAYDLTNSASNPYPAGSVSVMVNAVAPVLAIGGDASVKQRSPDVLALPGFDPAGDGINGWTVNWGDGSSTTVSGNPSSLSHVYRATGTFTISASASKVGLSFAANNTTVQVTQQVVPLFAVGSGPGAPATVFVYNAD